MSKFREYLTEGKIIVKKDIVDFLDQEYDNKLKLSDLEKITKELTDAKIKFELSKNGTLLADKTPESEKIINKYTEEI